MQEKRRPEQVFGSSFSNYKSADYCLKLCQPLLSFVVCNIQVSVT